MTVVSDSVYGHALKFTAVNQRRVFWATSNVWVKNKTYTVSFVAKSSVTGKKFDQADQQQIGAMILL